MYSINSIETYAYGMSKDLIYKTEQIKQLSIIKTISECLTLIVTNDGIKEHNPKWPEIPDHPYWILITGGSGSGKNKCITKSNK